MKAEDQIVKAARTAQMKMKLIDLMTAYSHARRVMFIIQTHDPSQTLRKFPNQRKLFENMTDIELGEFFNYIERMDNLICSLGESYNLELVKPPEQE